MSQDPKPFTRPTESPEPSEEERWRRACSSAYRRTLALDERLRVLEGDMKDLRTFITRLLTRSEN